MGVVGGGDGGAGVQEEVVVVEEKAQEEKLRIILRAKDMPEVKLRVKATTKIADLVAAFRAQRETEVAGRGVELWFDGDRMEEEDCVGDADLEDLSGVDVVVEFDALMLLKGNNEEVAHLAYKNKGILYKALIEDELL
ncbi:hypothetical protein V497_08429 [Pseudogymnoascus sp. VKM F-4516 (FW-969)]|nr:hypothetical protein V497_08429 [Pseudogymnoascus sp. VKM F-4516 (FW-969)]